LKVNIREIARKLNIEIIEKTTPRNIRGSAFKVKDKWYITVNQFDSEERKNFTIAHELAEIELDSREDLTLDEKHNLSNILAAEKLLPEHVFKEDIYHYNLYELKKLYPQASYEVIARRTLAYKKAVLTVFDNFIKTLRIGSDGINYPQQLFSEEKELIDKCYKQKEYVQNNRDNLIMHGYFIDEGMGMQRVILLTEIDEV